jgi:lipid A 3-O-deacylase
MILRLVTLSLILLLALASHAAIAREAVGARFVSFTFENDFLVGFDRHYTNGVQAAFLVEIADLPRWMRGAPPFASSTDPHFVLALGQRLFTPSDTDLVIPDPADRPYAGWLYVLGDWRVRADERVLDHVMVSLGVVGPSARGRQAQNGVHDFLGQAPARGWNSQIPNRTAFTLGFDRAWPSVIAGRLGAKQFDFTPRAGVTVGNILSYVNAGTIVRYGDALPADVPATAISLGPPRDGYRGAVNSGWYAWGGVDARVVGRNYLIDGGTIARKRFGFDLQAGIALVWPEARLSFAVIQRSREFESQDKPDRFAQLSFSLAY